MSLYICPKGHESTESDYCSECGTKINGQASVSVLPPSTSNQICCPDCAAPHEAESGNFCEICGYNFLTGASGEVPPLQANRETTKQPPSIEDDKTENVSPLATPQTLLKVELIATVDPSLWQKEDSPEPPANQKPLTFSLDKESNLIGRTSEKRGIYPEIALDFDDAVSHRHALINILPHGTVILRDIGSTNGTNLRGVELAKMVDTPLQNGDEFTLGHWTRILVKIF